MCRDRGRFQECGDVTGARGFLCKCPEWRAAGPPAPAHLGHGNKDTQEAWQGIKSKGGEAFQGVGYASDFGKAAVTLQCTLGNGSALGPGSLEAEVLKPLCGGSRPSVLFTSTRKDSLHTARPSGQPAASLGHSFAPRINIWSLPVWEAVCPRGSRWDPASSGAGKLRIGRERRGEKGLCAAEPLPGPLGLRCDRRSLWSECDRASWPSKWPTFPVEPLQRSAQGDRGP